MDRHEAFVRTVRAVRLLFDGENICLAARGEEILRDSYLLGAEAKKEDLNSLADAWIDQLIATRLMAKDQSMPLIEDDDAHVVLAMMQQAGALDPAMAAELYSILGIALYLFAVGLMTTGGGNQHIGFQQTAQALTLASYEHGVAAISILETEKAIEAIDFRTTAFRHCMTPTSWQTFAKLQIDLLERGSGDPALSEARVSMAIVAREYFAARKQEIWPAL